jgi:hypothetical protein
MTKVIKGKGMCTECALMEIKETTAYKTGKIIKYKYCTYYMSRCKAVARNCLGSF